MLEERLSHTYGQHSIGGYGSPTARPSSSIYPSISSNFASGASQAENFYNSNVVPTAPVDYGPTGSSMNSYGQYQQAEPSQPPYQQELQYPTNHGQLATHSQSEKRFAPQRTGSIQSHPSVDLSQRSETTYHNNMAYPPQSTLQQPQMPFNQQYSQAPVSPASETASTFYQDPNHRQDLQATPASVASISYAPGQQQPSPVLHQKMPPAQSQPHINSSEMLPPYQQSQVTQTQQYPPQNSYVPQREAQSGYWQQQQQQTAPSGPATNLPPPSTTYHQPTAFPGHAFPAAPTHQPQVKAVEESLIEL